jgi:hypothetical protein
MKFCESHLVFRGQDLKRAPQALDLNVGVSL